MYSSIHPFAGRRRGQGQRQSHVMVCKLRCGGETFSSRHLQAQDPPRPPRDTEALYIPPNLQAIGKSLENPLTNRVELVAYRTCACSVESIPSNIMTRSRDRHQLSHPIPSHPISSQLKLKLKLKLSSLTLISSHLISSHPINQLPKTSSITSPHITAVLPRAYQSIPDRVCQPSSLSAK